MKGGSRCNTLYTHLQSFSFFERGESERGPKKGESKERGINDLPLSMLCMKVTKREKKLGKVEIKRDTTKRTLTITVITQWPLFVYVAQMRTDRRVSYQFLWPLPLSLFLLVLLLHYRLGLGPVLGGRGLDSRSGLGGRRHIFIVLRE